MFFLSQSCQINVKKRVKLTLYLKIDVEFEYNSNDNYICINLNNKAIRSLSHRHITSL